MPPILEAAEPLPTALPLPGRRGYLPAVPQAACGQSERVPLLAPWAQHPLQRYPPLPPRGQKLQEWNPPAQRRLKQHHPPEQSPPARLWPAWRRDLAWVAT